MIGKLIWEQKMNDLGIGKLIEGEQQRDAIHVAIVPMTANEPLVAGEHVGLVKGSKDLASWDAVEKIGVVDPFLTVKVRKDQRFWLFLYPNTVTSLRHCWTHPAFQDLPVNEQARDKTFEQQASERWLRSFADEVGVTYDALMKGAYDWLTNQDTTHLPYDTPDCVYSDTEEMWRHYEIVTGRKVTDGDKRHFFSCSC